MNKLLKLSYSKSICVLFFLVTVKTLRSQDSVLNQYGLWVLKDITSYNKTLQRDSSKKMIDLTRLIPSLVLDLRYATTNNFMHEKLYPYITTTYLRKNAALALQQVQDELTQQGLCLKIFDAYRPYTVTEKMWEPVKDDRYAADPKKGSGHNRGIAVDLTIINIKTKKELDMGTGFDNFSDTAHHSFIQLPKEVLTNRLLLKNTMEKYGFIALPTEWWHYYIKDGEKYELLDLSFAMLKAMN